MGLKASICGDYVLLQLSGTGFIALSVCMKYDEDLQTPAFGSCRNTSITNQPTRTRYCSWSFSACVSLESYSGNYSMDFGHIVER